MASVQQPSEEKHAVPLVVLDRHGQIRDFTPEAAAVFRLAASDHGAPFTAALARTGLEGIGARILDVLEAGSATRLDLGRNTHHHLLVLPNHSADGTASGASIALVEN